MEYWKLGCRWGSKSEGKPLFLDLLMRHNIVITWSDRDFGKGNLVLLTDGFTPIGIARTLSAKRKVEELREFEHEFIEKQIDLDPDLYYYKAEIYPLTEPGFNYEYQVGIAQIHSSTVQQNMDRLYSTNNNERRMQETERLLRFKKQIILQGPPGTGKTRLAMQLAKELTGIRDTNELEESGQLQVVQFHPSYSYEDFVEGLKPKTKKEGMTFEPEEGIFKSFCKRALVSTLNNDGGDADENSFNTIFKKYIDHLKGNPETVFFTKNNSEMVIDSISETSITTKYKYANREKTMPGTQPCIISRDKLNRVVEQNLAPDEIKTLKTQLQPIVGHIAGELFAVYRHLYKFMEENAIELDEVQTEHDFQSALDEFNALDQKGLANFDKPFVLIIDEMNRADLSTVLGELISLMEDGKRLGASEALTLELPYSKEHFGIPKNVYIIGTMNTADRSVSHIDYAVRRRFAFVSVLPKDLSTETDIEFDADLFFKVEKLFVSNGGNSQHLSSEFEAKDVQLGHSYFIKKDGEGGSMQMRLEYEIKPILREYLKDGILKVSAENVIEELTCSE